MKLAEHRGPGMRVAIVGCGLVGQKRGRALAGARLVACVDTARDRAEALARTAPGALALGSWREAIERQDVDVVVVATPHHLLADITGAAVGAGKHVLVEKPGARRVHELDAVIDAATRAAVMVRVGFNHRYHPGLRQARQLVRDGAVGDLMYVRGRYGHEIGRAHV